jgi:predicted CXXCH cytochrome family protein
MIRTIRDGVLPTCVTVFMSLSLAAGCEPAADEAAFVGGAVCAECHVEQFARWRGSHHDLAMQVADSTTVLGDFNDATFPHFGVTSAFTRPNGRYMVRTDGPDGALEEFEVAYTFGVAPLQQYLIAFPGGRYQALGTAWDARPAVERGQRWFHLYPDESIPHTDVLHWTRPLQNWNYMCAECHSTDLQKGYDRDTDTYVTTWSEIDVSCEACHGPGSLHVAWAQNGECETDAAGTPNGLVVRLADAVPGAWEFAGDSPTARSTDPLGSRQEVESCARCHSRRSVLRPDYVYGRPLLDTHEPALLEEELYYPDGQIFDEVYVYGSFLQSRMYRSGVTCTDCHDPHALTLRADGNAVCAPCHLPAMYEGSRHHFHPRGSTGSRCVECHMPSRTYMVVDPRRDHSFPVPRPDLSMRLGTPNACTNCHTDRADAWAASAVGDWYGPSRGGTHFGETLAAGRTGVPAADTALARLAADSAQSDIVRATAVSLLAGYPSRAAVEAIGRSLHDSAPLVRLAGARALGSFFPVERLGAGFHLLGDSVLVVRIAAARSLAAVPSEVWSPTTRAVFDSAAAEYVVAQQANADRPEAHLNLGVFSADLGRFADAEASYRTALRLDSAFVQAAVNLADLYRAQGRDDRGARVLREALAVAPGQPALQHAWGLLLVRQDRLDEALVALERAVELAPDDARFAYVYAIALESSGDAERAVTVLEQTLERRPYNRSVLMALVTMQRDRGQVNAALSYARQMVELWPADTEARELLTQLEAEGQ